MSRTRLVTILIAIAAPLSALYMLLSGWVDLGIPALPSVSFFSVVAGADTAVALQGPGPQTDIVVALGLFGALLYAVVRFWLWWQVRGSRGSVLLLSAAIIGAFPLLAQAWIFAFSHASGSTFTDWLVLRLPPIFHFAAYWGWLVLPLALLLLGAGLLRSRFVSPWIAALALVAGILGALAAQRLNLPTIGSLDLEYAAYVPAVLTELAFLVGLGVSLALRSAGPSRAGDSVVPSA